MTTSPRSGTALLVAAATLALAAVLIAAPSSQAEGPDAASAPEPDAEAVGPEPRAAFLERVDPSEPREAASPDEGPRDRSSLLASWDLEPAASTPMQLLDKAPVGDDAVPAKGCAPHPPIEITEEVGQQGFVLGHEPTTGEPIYRPGSGVVDGTGTAEDPYVIEGWCIQATGNTQGQPTCIIVPGVERWCGDVPNDLVEAPDAAISIEGTDAHVVVRDNVVAGSSLTVSPLAPSANGIYLDEVANVTVQDNAAALTSSGVVVLDSEAVDVRSNTIAYALSGGVVASGSPALTVTDNHALLTWRGVWVIEAGPATLVEDNEVSQATVEGIRVQGSEQALVQGNLVDGVAGNLALRVDESTGLRLAGNELVGGGLALTGDRLAHHVHDVDETNRVNGEPLVYLHGDHGTRVEEPVGQLVVVDANGVKAEGLHVTQAAYGIHVVDSAGTDIREVLVEGTRNGIVLDGTAAARVADSAVDGASPAPGILVDGARQTRLEANNVTASGFDGGILASAGIVVTGSEDTRLADNTAVGNEGFGIGVWGGSSDTTLDDDEARDNALHGLVVGGSSTTELRSVAASGNGGFGVDVRGTETTVEQARLETNTGGGLRLYDAAAANVTDTRILRPASGGLVDETPAGGEQANGIEVWETAGARLEANTVRGHANGTVLYGANEQVTVHGNEIAGNGIGVWVQASLFGQPEDLRIEGNAIEANAEAGLHARNLQQPLDARDNWWGQASGPSGGIADACTGSLADGDGQAIQASGAGVCFDPWLDASPS